MKTLSMSLLFPVLTGLFVTALPLSADTVLFDGKVRQGTLWVDSPKNATIEISDEVPYPPTNTPALKWMPQNGSAYRSGGLSFYSTPLATMENETIIRIAVYTSEPETVSSFTVDTSAGSFSFENSKGTWTVDGETGTTNLLFDGEWHVVELDLTSIEGFVPGETKLTGKLASINKSPSAAIYFGDIRLVSAAKP